VANINQEWLDLRTAAGFTLFGYNWVRGHLLIPFRRVTFGITTNQNDGFGTKFVVILVIERRPKKAGFTF